MRHVVWDWNGTLFDDLHIVVAAVNVSLGDLGAPPIDTDGYRDHYTRPVRLFYEGMLGRPVTTEEFATIDRVFHTAYEDSLDRAGLAADALPALDRVSRGASQSLLSMWRHDSLVEYVGLLGLTRHMVRIDGNRSTDDATKARALADHIDRLFDEAWIAARTDVLVVGDGLDDARSAAAAGVDCVLYDGGTHHRHELETADVPVADTLQHALDLGGVA